MTHLKTAAIVAAAALPFLAFSAKKPTDDTSNPAYKETQVVMVPNTTGKPAKPAGFVHPGVMVNRAQLDEIKRRVAAGVEPQKSAFEALKASKWGALDYTPHPRATVECGSNSNPDLGCKDEQADSEAAYGQALLWYITGNKAYAENSIRSWTRGPQPLPAATPTPTARCRRPGPATCFRAPRRSCATPTKAGATPPLLAFRIC